MSDQETNPESFDSITVSPTTSDYEFTVRLPDCGKLRFDRQIKCGNFSSFPDKNLCWSLYISKITEKSLRSRYDDEDEFRATENYSFNLVNTTSTSSIVSVVDISAAISGFNTAIKDVKFENRSVEKLNLTVFKIQSKVFLTGKNVIVHFKIRYHSLQTELLRKPEWAKPKGDGMDLLRTIYEDRQFCDMTLSVGDAKIQAHQVILAAQSSYFRAIFSHGTTETVSSCIDASDFDPLVITDMLEFMYTGKVPFASKFPSKDQELELCTASELLRAADKYQVEALKSVCERFLYNYINLDSVIEVFQLADRYSCPELESEAVEYMRINLTSLVDTEKWRTCFNSNSKLEAKFFRVMTKDASQLRVKRVDQSVDKVSSSVSD